MAGPEKSDGAFRTIREVADWLGVPTHVLRFWESKFDQIAPVKGAGGRRYYRPEDMRLLGGIKVMLHDQGLPIRGVIQKIDDEGSEAVMALSPGLDMSDTAAAPRTRRVIRQREDDSTPAPGVGKSPAAVPTPSGPGSVVTSFPLPEPVEPDPPQPGDETTWGQLGDETATPQPADDPVEEPLDGSGQPDVPSTDDDLSQAPEPDSDPEADPVPAPRPVPAPPASVAPADPDDDQGDGHSNGHGGRISVAPGNQRRLRRIVRKLRGLIEEVEAEIRETEDAARDA